MELQVGGMLGGNFVFDGGMVELRMSTAGNVLLLRCCAKVVCEEKFDQRRLNQSYQRALNCGDS